MQVVYRFLCEDGIKGQGVVLCEGGTYMVKRGCGQRQGGYVSGGRKRRDVLQNRVCTRSGDEQVGLEQRAGLVVRDDG